MPTRRALIDVPPEPEGNNELPVICVTSQRLRDLTAEALDALVGANDPPVLYVRHGELVRVIWDEHGRARLGRVAEPVLRHRLERCADFVRITAAGKKAGTITAVVPPPEVVQDVLASGSWPFPPVEGITPVPVLRPDGSVLIEPGYDEDTKLIYAPDPALVVPPIPDRPTNAQLEAARRLVLDILCEFPFVDFASMANMVALLFTPVLRPAIAGLVPLALLDKPKRGTGATLLAKLVTLLALGSSTDLMTAPTSDEEWRKKLTSALLAGLTVIFLDNVEHPLSCPHLAACLTSEYWSDRILGRSEMAQNLVQRATWMATGNNIKVGGDLGRRCYHIRLDAKTARPWGRSGFRRPQLAQDVRAHRGEILAAMLTLARGWFARGCETAETPTVGGFEEWTRVLGGLLAFMRVPGFLQNLNALYEDVDEEDTSWATFLAGWHQQFGDVLTTVADVAVEVKADTSPLRAVLPPAVLDALTGKSKQSFEHKLSWALRKHKGAIFGDHRLDSDDARHWRVSRAREGGYGGYGDYSQLERPSENSADGTPGGNPMGTNPPNPGNPSPTLREPGEDG